MAIYKRAEFSALYVFFVDMCFALDILLAQFDMLFASFKARYDINSYVSFLVLLRQNISIYIVKYRT